MTVTEIRVSHPTT